MRRVLVLLSLVAVVAACGTSASPATARPTATQDPRHITKADYGADWPLTADAGTLSCVESAGECSRPLVTFDSGDGIEYALNGAAVDCGVPELDETILLGFPDKTGVLPLINRGLEFCEQGGASDLDECPV